MQSKPVTDGKNDERPRTRVFRPRAHRGSTGAQLFNTNPSSVISPVSNGANGTN